jgi:hypothetical protein
VPISAAQALPSWIRPLSADEALAMNRSIPLSNEPVIQAPPFRFTGDSRTRLRALTCLTAAIYYEAGNQGEEGEEAVAQVVLNRVRHPAFPASICGVVFQGSTQPSGCQFTFTCDGSLMRTPDRRNWAAAEEIADRALSGQVFAPVGLSTHYHADYVVPYWATSLAKTAQIGAHIFYHWPSTWGDLRPFAARYQGVEPDPGSLRAAALMAEGSWPQNPDVRSGPQIELAADPQLQLAGVIGLLSAADDQNSGKYARDVRAYFGGASGAFAVQLFRYAVSNADDATKPQLSSSFSDALAEFAATTDSRAFFHAHRAYYRDAVSRLGRALAPAVSQWQEYTAMELPPLKLAVAVGPSDSFSTCTASKLLGRNAMWLDESAEPDSSEELFISSGIANDAFGSAEISSQLKEQVVRAVFARIVALSAGEAAGREAAMRAGIAGYDLVPEFADRLQDYERHRNLYPSLRDFLPVLTRGLSQPETAPTADDHHAAAREVSAQCAQGTPASLQATKGASGAEHAG